MTTISSFSQLANLLKSHSLASFTTTASDGHLHSRPMVVQQVDPEGVLWFFMSRTSQPFAQAMANPHVAIALHGQQGSTHVSITGLASEDADRIRASQLWRDEYLRWFPLGSGDPDLALLRVVPVTGECWDEDSEHHCQIGHARH